MDSGAGGGEMESPVTAERPAVAIDFSAAAEDSASSSSRIPRRIQRRLMESSSKGGGGPSSVEEIEAKLRDADLRRQQFHEWLSSKARRKPKSPSWSPQDEDLAQRLEAKLVAAEQKRLSLLANAQMRLAKLDELRQAAKNGVEMRAEKEREELGTKVELRVKQAEANRMRLLKAHMQRRAAAKERTARSLLQRIIRENKYKECIRSAISEKRAAAEKKRLGLLEAEQRRAHARTLQASRIAKKVCHQREIEQRRLKEQLEKRLQKAKRQRTEYLKQRGSPRSPCMVNVIEYDDLPSRKIARCWRQFVKSRSTTFTLAKAYEAVGINEKLVKKMPFEKLAILIESAKTLQTMKALLDRLETCFLVYLSSTPSNTENIDHLLKRLATPNRRVPASRTRNRGATRKTSMCDCKVSEQNKPPRYSVRVVLCAYMILGHPNAVFSGQGEREVSLRESAISFIRELELLIRVILDRSSNVDSSKKASLDLISVKDSSANLPGKQTFRGQLAAFDAAWRSYLYHFVVWKVKDARSLEEDLVRAACQLELSMMQTCKITSEGQTSNLTLDMKAIQKQVIDDQKLLRAKVQHLSGDAGIERMECALSDTRSKFFEAKESGSPMAPQVAHVSSPSSSGSQEQQPLTETPSEKNGKSKSVARVLFGDAASAPALVDKKSESADVQPGPVAGIRAPSENELIVNEIMHRINDTFADNVDAVNIQSEIQVKVKETMEKAFWDEIVDSMKKGEPDYSRIISLVKEVQDELCELAPDSWKQDIVSSIDLDILTQVLQTGNLDIDYLRKVLEYSLAMLQKLSSPANEAEMKKSHQKLLYDLADKAQLNEGNSFVVVTVKGLRFVLEEIQKLKKEVSKVRIQLLEPIIKGSAGLEYLNKAFSDRYGDPTDAANSLPITVQWFSSLSVTEDEWDEHMDFLSSVPSNYGLPPTTLRTGGSVSAAEKQRSAFPSGSGGDELPECSGEKVDKMVRLGLLKLASAIEGLTTETVPETLVLNVIRLRSVQAQFQQIIVSATSMLVLRQILLSENPSASSELQDVVANTVNGLYELFDRAPDAGIEEIIEVMMSSSSSFPSPSETKLQTRKEMIARVLLKSLQNGDAVFGKVSRSVYLATRGLVLGGTGSQGRKLADTVLKRIGATVLLDQVVKVAQVLITMASVTTQVHGPWYHSLI